MDKSSGHGRGEQVVHHVEDSPHVAHDVAGPHINFPPYMKYNQDRGKARSESELKSVFVITSPDKYSVDVPGVLEKLCGYLNGLETVSKQLQNMDGQSDVSMDVDVSETGHGELLSDYASDAEITWLGLTLKGYQERMKQVKENEALHGWLMIYEQFVGHCCEEEKKIAVVVTELRQHPERDNMLFCRHNMKRHFESMVQRWKSLTTINDILSNESESLNRCDCPCLMEYSITELQFGSDEFLKQVNVPSNITMPERWTCANEPTSKWIRQTLSEIVISCNELNERIKIHISRMEEIRKEKFTTIYNRWNGLNLIVRRLNERNRVPNTAVTEEETWYNESSYSYIDLYLNDTERESSKKEARCHWETSAKEKRTYLSKVMVKSCDDVYQQYGELVKGFRTERESKRRGIQTHVSELEAKICQMQSELNKQTETFKTRELRWSEKDLATQQKNADLTFKLDKAEETLKQIKPQGDSEWRKRLETKNLEHKQQLQQLKAQEELRFKKNFESLNIEHKRQLEQMKAQEGLRFREYIEKKNLEHNRQVQQLSLRLAETRKEISDLKLEKENLLTRLSKIAGSKLVHGNPAITDLSDANRPTKVSEKYSELYDNEWTDALEELIDTEGMNQEVVYTKTLRAILIEAFTFCCETEAGYVKTVTQSLTSLPGPDPDCTVQEQKHTAVRPTLTQEQRLELDELRKACVHMLVPAVESKFLAYMEKQFENLFKQVGGQIERGNKLPYLKDDLDTQKQVPVCAVPTDDQREHHSTENQQSSLDEGQSTQKPKHEEGNSPADEQPASPNSSQDQTENIPQVNHKQFSLGPAKVLPDQNSLLPETIHESKTSTPTHVPFSSLEKLSNFARICVKLCWFMRIQNPPMHIDTELQEGTEINFDFYKNYTQKGKHVGYLVWPALFRHKNGPLLCKGIVQPLSTKKE